MQRSNKTHDPVCGMDVDPSRAPHRFEYGDKTYFFCSARCLNTFCADPQGHLPGRSEARKDAPTSRGPADRAEGGRTYTCPMHPEIVSDKPGKCPKCGMNLVAKSPEPAVKYTCPMHPDVISDKPGKCPKCGMNLEPMQPVKK